MLGRRTDDFVEPVTLPVGRRRGEKTSPLDKVKDKFDRRFRSSAVTYGLWELPLRNGERDFHGEKRSNATHASSTDPEAQLYRKGRGKEAKLSFMGHALMENRSGLIVAATLTKATGTAERQAAEEMIVRHSPGARRITLGSDKAYDAAAFVADMRALNVTPHIAQNISGRRSAIDARTTRHPGYAVSQQKRKRIEEPFGWGKTIGGLARPMLRGAKKLGFKFTLAMASYNLIRLPKLLEAIA